MKDQLTISKEDISNIIKNIGNKPENIIALLHNIQKKYSYLPERAIELMADQTDMTVAHIISVASFYSEFRFQPKGKFQIKVCIGTACHVKGADNIFNEFKRFLKIPDDHDTDINNLFTIDRVACLGCCMLAPAVQIENYTYGPVTKNIIPNIIRDFLSSIHSTKKTPKKIKTLPVSGYLKICLCSSCRASGTKHLYEQIKCLISKYNLPALLKQVSCSGLTFHSPVIEIELTNKKQFKYGLVDQNNLENILFTHFTPQTISKKIQLSIYSLLKKISTNQNFEPITRFVLNDTCHNIKNYINDQTEIATKHKGLMNPLDLSEYQQYDGLKAFHNCLKIKDQNTIIQTIKDSKLRGRGGAGFETAEKWKLVKQEKSDIKYLICNGDEGDPGAFMDRMLLESYPFRIIEGMLIAAYTCGINQGYIFIRSEYPLAVKRIQTAVNICEQNGLLKIKTDDVLFQFNIKIIESAGAFICGEETALISSIEGNRATPHIRPPYPSKYGLWQKPTLVNNVETFALIPWILLHGSKQFSDLGCHNSKGTKTFAIAGKIRNSGLIEVEMGMTFHQIIYSIGGGIPGNKELKAVQIGGPSGGCLPANLIHTPIDYESLKSINTIMGSGGIIILDEDDCIVDVAKYFMDFTHHESCGKCTFGRIGTKRMQEILQKLTEGTASLDDLNKLQSLALLVQKNSLCGLGKSAPNPVLSALNYFYQEFVEHIHLNCPAMKCKSLIKYEITKKCIGCTKCAQNCPVQAIELDPYNKHLIDQNICIKCDNCRITCPQDAITKTSMKEQANV